MSKLVHKQINYKTRHLSKRTDLEAVLTFPATDSRTVLAVNRQGGPSVTGLWVDVRDHTQALMSPIDTAEHEPPLKSAVCPNQQTAII